MDYFSVIVLVIVVFIFMSDRKVKDITIIEKENNEILKQIEQVKQNLKIVKLETKDMNYDEILKNIQTLENKYILIQNSKLKLSNQDIDTIIANYIVEDESGKSIGGFNLLYSYNEKKWSLKKLYVDVINYLNIFNKQELATYGVIICRKSDKTQTEKQFKENLISYTPAEFTNITFENKEINKKKLKKIYINKLSNANISIILKILLLIISGSIITTNLIYAIFNVNNINGLIIAAVIYYCYSYIIRYIYKPIGKQRILATYIFPVYFVSYIVVSIHTLITKVIKKVHAS